MEDAKARLLCSKRWAALLEAVRSSGLGHGMLHAVAAHLTHLVPLPPPVPAAAAAAAEDSEPSRPDSRQRSTRGGLEARHAPPPRSASTPTTPPAAATRYGDAVAAPAAAWGAAVDALVTVPDPIAVAKGKAGKKAGQYEV